MVEEKLEKIGKSLTRIENTHFFLCGGSVRDAILGQPCKDYDFVAVTSLPFDSLVEQVKRIGQVFQTKKEFLTMRCKVGGEIIDITLPRAESEYLDGRHPAQVNPIESLWPDSKRRDFTINAMYKSLDGDITDYHTGRQDLEEGVIRCVGNPYQRFAEDHLRIIRALRFSATLGFTILPQVQEAICHLKHKLVKVAPDRIREEINKGLLSNPVKMLEMLVAYDMIGMLELLGIRLEVRQ